MGCGCRHGGKCGELGGDPLPPVAGATRMLPWANAGVAKLVHNGPIRMPSGHASALVHPNSARLGGVSTVPAILLGDGPAILHRTGEGRVLVADRPTKGLHADMGIYSAERHPRPSTAAGLRLPMGYAATMFRKWCQGCDWVILNLAEWKAAGFDITLEKEDGTERGKCQVLAEGCETEACQLGSYTIKVTGPKGKTFYTTEDGGKPKMHQGGGTVTLRRKKSPIKQFACGTDDSKPDNAPKTPARPPKIVKGNKSKPEEYDRDSAVWGHDAHTDVRVLMNPKPAKVVGNNKADVNAKTEYGFNKPIILRCTECKKL